MSGNKNQKQGNGYTIAPFPRERQLVIDTSRLGKRKHSIHGLVETTAEDWKLSGPPVRRN